MSIEKTEQDKTYDEAAMRKLGEGMGEMFIGLLEKGMSRREAHATVNSYLWALANRQAEKKHET